MTIIDARLESTRATIADDLMHARDAGVKWLVAHVSDIGEPLDADAYNAYYRVPWALATAGQPYAASSVLSWVEKHALEESGDLLPGAAQRPFITNDASYPLTVLALAAWHLERYDLANKIMDKLRDYQDPITGGAYHERVELRSTDRQGLMSTAQLGMTGLATGRREVAEGAFRWMVDLYKAQPELPHRLYTCSNSSGLITEFGDDVAFGHVVDVQLPRQAYFNLGIGAAFLGRYYLLTADPEAKRVGRELIRLSEKGTDRQFDYADTVHVGKVAWGAAVMLQVEPDEQLLILLERMTKWILDCQLADGRWNPSAFLYPAPIGADALWKTGEHVVIINMILCALGGYRSG